MYIGQLPGNGTVQPQQPAPLQTTDPQGDAPLAGSLPEKYPTEFSISDLADFTKWYPYAIIGGLLLLVGTSGGSRTRGERKTQAASAPTIYHYG